MCQVLVIASLMYVLIVQLLVDLSLMDIVLSVQLHSSIMAKLVSVLMAVVMSVEDVLRHVVLISWLIPQVTVISVL